MYQTLFELASGTTHAAGLVAHTLQGVEASQQELNAFTVVLADAARDAAAEADRRRARDQKAPLLGIPVAVNDEVDVSGAPSAFGISTVTAKATTDAAVVRRLRDAGAVIVGKTAAGVLGQQLCPTGLGGRPVRNPWALDHTPGASSAGAAAAVAAGLVPAAIGTDTGGGLRIAAAWTNLIGLKPGRGVFPAAALREGFNGLTSCGVLARTATDAALVLSAVAGDGSYRPRGIDRELQIAISGRFPFPAGLVGGGIDAEIAVALVQAGEVLESLGHRVVPGSADYGVRLWQDYGVRRAAGLYDWAYRQGGLTAVPDAAIRGRARLGLALSEVTLRRARAREPGQRKRIGRVFEIVDLLVTPTTSVPAPRLAEDAATAASPRQMLAMCPWTWPWNVLGWPAVSVPAGFTSDGLPVGVQLLGPPGSELLLLSVADMLMAANPRVGRQPDPQFSTTSSRTGRSASSEATPNGWG
ncbi:amidase family protein [Mycolicibacterium palauense]|uniref:amidase family protein n=1 Tax=Mycolicibacterium palauense TaxID=2034511 RepID=UPI000BFECBDE|nr:amidase family protein [Mycolicibacterium palauense]